MVSMSQAYSIRQLRKQGDSVAEIAREVEASAQQPGKEQPFTSRTPLRPLFVGVH